MATKTVKAKEFEITELAKLAARTKVITVKKSELRKGWDAVDDEVVEQIRVSDAACIASYKQQLLNGVI